MSADIDKLQGAWRITFLEVDGTKMTPALLSGARITLKEQTFTTEAMGAVYAGKLTLDEAASPKTFELKYTKGPEKGNTSYGIYDLKAKRWKICMTMRGGTHPKKFRTSKGSGLVLEELTREDATTTAKTKTPKKKVAAKTSVKKGATELDGEWRLVSGIRDGQPLDAMMVKSGKRTDKNGMMTVTFGPHVKLQADVTLLPDTNPKGMDYEHTGGMFAGQEQLGIYQLKGDELTICSAAPGKSRPKEFKSVTGDGRTLMVWKRKK